MASISSTTPTTCLCCGTAEAATLKCRYRGGTGTLIGCSEFTSPSSPPKKYRRITNSGSATSKYWSNSSCSGAEIGGDTVTCNYSGWGQYDKTTGTLTQGGSTVCNGGTMSTGQTCTGTHADACDSYWLNTPTVLSRLSTGACCNAGGGLYGKETADTLQQTLSDEDLESDAIARLLAGGGGTWSSWTTVGDGTGGTCVATTCCRAQYEQRTTLFTFAYNEAQFRVELGGLTPSTLYYTHVEIYRRVQGSGGSFTHYSTIILSATTDGSGNFSVDGDVPNDEGYESYAASATVIIPP